MDDDKTTMSRNEHINVIFDYVMQKYRWYLKTYLKSLYT